MRTFSKAYRRLTDIILMIKEYNEYNFEKTEKQSDNIES